MVQIVKGEFTTSGKPVTVVQNGVPVPAGDSVSQAYYLEETLRYDIPERFMALRPRWSAFDHVPIDDKVPYGAASIRFVASNTQGRAKPLAAGSNAQNRVTVSGAQSERPYTRYSVTLVFDELDVEAAALAKSKGVTAGDLFSDYLVGAHEAISDAINQVVWFGDQAAGQYGLVNSDLIPEIDAGGAITAATTADEAINTLKRIFSTMRTESKSRYNVERLLLPLSVHDLLLDKPRSTNSDKTVLDFLMQTRKGYGLQMIDGIDELDRTAETGGRGRVGLGLIKDESLFRFCVSKMHMGPMEVINGGAGYALSLFFKISDLVAPRPQAIVRMRNL